LVLGSGGPVGIGWEAGLLVGIVENGVDIRKADAVIGTSAGSPTRRDSVRARSRQLG
jgi:NTE family protein